MPKPKTPLGTKAAQTRVKNQMRQLREKADRPQHEIAAELGIGQPSYHDLEQGATRVKRRDLIALAAIYGISLDEAFPEPARRSRKEPEPQERP